MRSTLPTVEPLQGKPVPRAGFKARANGLLVFTDIPEERKITARVLRGLTGRPARSQAFAGGRPVGGADEVQARVASPREA